ncbi:MAG: hypothetical protein ABRQ24_07360, partial [Syntrophomonadaceae bacterium]
QTIPGCFLIYEIVPIYLAEGEMPPRIANLHMREGTKPTPANVGLVSGTECDIIAHGRVAGSGIVSLTPLKWGFRVMVRDGMRIAILVGGEQQGGSRKR